VPAVEETKEDTEVVLTTLVVALKSDVSTLDQNLLEFARKFFVSRFSYSQPGAKMAIEVLDARADRIATSTLKPPPAKGEREKGKRKKEKRKERKKKIKNEIIKRVSGQMYESVHIKPKNQKKKQRVHYFICSYHRMSHDQTRRNP